MAEAPAPRREDRPRRDDRREGRDDRRDRYRDRDDRSGPPVVGMGDHVPDFILRSFKIAAPTPDEGEDDSPANGTDG